LRKRRGGKEQRRKGVGDRNKTVFFSAVLSLKKKKNRSKILGRREGGWEKKIQKQGGKCRGEETDGMARRKWMGRVKREQTRGRRRGMDLYR
jgi:hypothetical protein